MSRSTEDAGTLKREEEQTVLFSLRLEEFSFKSPQTSPARRSTRSSTLATMRNPGSPSVKAEKSATISRKRTVESTAENDSPTKSKKKRGYAPPETYAHLNCLPDYLEEYLDVVICGINPGVHSASVGNHFSHPCNQFYKMLYGSGFTDHLVDPEDDCTLPARYRIGLTTIVNRPSTCETELSAEEMISGTPALLRKVAKYKPRFVCFLGKGMGQRVEKGFKREIAKHENLSRSREEISGKQKKRASPKKGAAKQPEDNGIGLRPFRVTHDDDSSPLVTETLFFVSHSSSGLATSMSLQGKIDLLKELRALVKKHKAGVLNISGFEEVPVLTDIAVQDV